jgi:serine/threonine-protein kinase
MVKEALAAGITAGEILSNGLLDGMAKLGVKFKNNEVYVPEVLIAARALNKGIELLKPYLDQRTDVYAASLVLWELLAGMKLFRSEDPAKLLRSIVGGEVEPPSPYATECTPKLDAIIMRGLSRDPGDRWPTARAMALALEDCVPPASAPHVGAWVERIAHADLAARAKLIAELEASSKPATLAEVFAEIRGTEEQTATDVDVPLPLK